MSLIWTKKQRETMAAVIDDDYETVDEAAGAALDAARVMFEQRAAFTVVGQLVATRERSHIPPEDPEAIKVALGWYDTEGKARSAAESLWGSAATGDQFAVWVLPAHHGTPADLHAEQKEKYAKAEAARKEKDRERMLAGIEKRRQEAEERNNGGKGSCENCSHPSWEHGVDGSSKGACKLPECKCERWKELKK